LETRLPQSPIGFGRDWFILSGSDVKFKMRYLAAQVYTALTRQTQRRAVLVDEVYLRRARTMLYLPGEVISDIGMSWLPDEQLEDLGWDEDLVDHQSAWTLPCAYGSEEPDKDFIRDLYLFLQRGDAVVFGGDTEDRPEDWPVIGVRHEAKGIQELRENPAHWTARKDGRVWVLFDRLDGTRLRMTFEDGQFEDTKATTPELVDIKLTDRCPYRCAFCYQDSLPDGRDVPMISPYMLAEELAKLKVFEVALGGGEITLSRDFPGLLSEFRHCGIVPNFSTRNLGWLAQPDVARVVDETAGGVGISVVGPGHKEALDWVRDALVAWKSARMQKARLTFQVIPDMFNENTLEQILIMSGQFGAEVLFLDFKRAGRGKDTILVCPDWTSLVSRLNAQDMLPRFSIDTPLAARWQSWLQRSGVPRIAYHLEEGKFGCYIDAVRGLVGPCSYAPEDQMVKLTLGDKERPLCAQVQEAFAKW
jgi:hypothetical protein